MGKIKNIKDQRFGKLVVIEFKKIKNHRAMWLCKCNCGKKIITSSHCLLSGGTNSCGCIHKEQLVERNKKHNMSYTKLYKVWQAMKTRCYNKNFKYYKNYGGRGIKVCDEWLNDFETFYKWAINNGYKEHLTIDRINVNGNYKPSNCRWATQKEQSLNKTNNHFITYKNETYTISQWSEKMNLSYSTIRHRLKRGWDVEKALTTPLIKK